MLELLSQSGTLHHWRLGHHIDPNTIGESWSATGTTAPAFALNLKHLEAAAEGGGREEYRVRKRSGRATVGWRRIRSGFELPGDWACGAVALVAQAQSDSSNTNTYAQTSGTTTTLYSGLSSSVDPKGYSTSLKSIITTSDADSTRACFSTHSSICLEERAGRRNLIKAECEQCPKGGDAWLEALRLHHNHDEKVILANAVRNVGQNDYIWMAVPDLEHGIKAKKHVLRKALEHIPNLIRLWKEIAKLESSHNDPGIILSRAVQVIPLRHPSNAGSTPGSKRLIAQRACSTKPENTSTSHERVRQGEDGKIIHTIELGVKELKNRYGLLMGKQRSKLAEATVSTEIEKEGWSYTWEGDAEGAERAEGRRMVGMARMVLVVLDQTVHHSTVQKPTWLMSAKQQWLAGDALAAREVLQWAFVANPENEKIWLVAVKLKTENASRRNFSFMRERSRIASGKSAVFERYRGHHLNSPETPAAARTEFSTFVKLYMIQGQIHQATKNFPSARGSLAAGPGEQARGSGRGQYQGRSILDKARPVDPANDVLSAEAVGAEDPASKPWSQYEDSRWVDGPGREWADWADATKAPAGELLESYVAGDISDGALEVFLTENGWGVLYTYNEAMNMDYVKNVVWPICNIVPIHTFRAFREDFGQMTEDVVLLAGEIHYERKPCLRSVRVPPYAYALVEKLANRIQGQVGGRMWVRAQMRRGDFVNVAWAMGKTFEAHFDRIRNRLSTGRSTCNLANLSSHGALPSALLTPEDYRAFGWPLLFTDVLGVVEQALLAHAHYFYAHARNSFAGGVVNGRAVEGMYACTAIED
ncbi:hypothetical protein FIBSPDRAFT_894478 [Athelia psychrophila]|uniref:Uncharacterized protein n=1 Tax=Athelia psychrophila TaxID=1759441 RepID=A0A166FQU0_9AGAM|nr:hypothetical protein FIBSPDRAFT_894478 [Fibularhizoctonia sp. CBS 109695]